MNTLKNIIAKKEHLFMYLGHNGSIAYLNHKFKDINKKITYTLEIDLKKIGLMQRSGCTSLPLHDIRNFNKEAIAVFCTRQYESYDLERQLRRYGLIHNVHYFYVEDFTVYPIKEDYYRGVTHAPWSMDTEFIDVYNAMREHTLLDIYRAYELKSLLEQCAHLPGNVLEVGVYLGGSGFLLTSYANKFNKKTYLADTFCGFVNTDHAFDRAFFEAKREDFSANAKGLFAASTLHDYEFLVGSFPEDTGQYIADEKFCFVHIDTDVYHAVKNPTEWVWDKLAVGGVIVYDDYGFGTFDGATRFVDDIARLQDRMFIYNLNGHGIIIKIHD